MSSDKLFFYIIKRNDNFDLTALSENKLAWYNLPDDYKDLAEHKVLCSKRVIKNTIMTIKPINGYRKIGITIDDELRKEYYDEDGNLCFLNMPLEEANISNEHVVADKSDEKNFLIEKIKELEAKLNLDNKFKLHDVEKRFILDKFNKSQNVNDWLEKFENECIRHKIFDATNMIEALRFFLSGSAENWYDANIIKIGLTNWSEWRASFLTVFADKENDQILIVLFVKYLINDFSSKKCLQEFAAGSTRTGKKLNIDWKTEKPIDNLVLKKFASKLPDLEKKVNTIKPFLYIIQW
ncbi:hypothetical protein HELRODRAFT_165992 [Helobdella robusta]|uniref:Uncharacterized protein n=1 Tax=Helobdella robusta TaxID=6412 RepID=T1EXJ6_HELRO|nr:hypothetical protein HELRODRAFT_165992 [Helobdella robusta]ESN90333.1 hypothetical protein HELRODRAFT_165992 [Helobdella robusta]